MLAHTRQHAVSLLRSLGSLLPGGGRGSKPTLEARVVRPWRDDAAHMYPSVGITPSRVLNLLQSADAGTPQLQFELFAEMLQKWPRLAAVEATRRLALTGLEWEISPHDNARVRSPRGAALDAARLVSEATAAGDAGRRVEIAHFCRESLTELDRFREGLDHLANAIAYGISVCELVWDGGRLIDIVPVPYSRLIADPDEPWRLRVRTEDDQSRGVALDDQPAKWVVHRPKSRPGRQFEGGLLRASALLYVAQNLSFKDWLIYSQIAGMPVRVARFEPGTPQADKDALLTMLTKLGTDAVAAFSKNVDLDLLEAKSGQKPYQPLQDYCNVEITILWLGQHLTTDMRSTGSRAAAEVHDRVREDLLVDDIHDEAATIRRDLLGPLVRARFGDDAPVPRFRRSLIQSIDTKSLAETLSVAVNELGLRVPNRWLHQTLGIPEPEGEEAVVEGGGG